MPAPIIRSVGSINGTVDGAPRSDCQVGEHITLSDLQSANTGASYVWAIKDKPPGSSASLVGATSSSPTFVLDATGPVWITCTVGTGPSAFTSETFIGVALPNSGFRLPALDERKEYDANSGWRNDQIGLWRWVDERAGSYVRVSDTDTVSTFLGDKITVVTGEIEKVITDPTGNAQVRFGLPDVVTAGAATVASIAWDSKGRIIGASSGTRGTNIQSVGSANAPGTSAHFAAEDHVHGGVGEIQANVNTDVLGDFGGGTYAVKGWPLIIDAAIDANYTIAPYGTVLRATTTTADRNINLPALTTTQEGVYHVVIDGSSIAGHTLHIVPDGTDTINGVNASYDLPTARGQSITVFRDSSGWLTYGGGSTYTFSTGLAGTSTITANIATGVAGGQTAYGGINAGDGLTIVSTTNPTKGAIQLGATSLATFNENLTKASGAAATLDAIKFPSNTVTITGTTGIATTTGFNYVSIAAPTYTDVSAVTVTNAATLAITGAPAVAGSVTITNPRALWVQSGETRLDGNVITTTTNASGSSLGGLAAIRIRNTTGNVSIIQFSFSGTGDVVGSAIMGTNNGLQLSASNGTITFTTTSGLLEAARFTSNLNTCIGTQTDVASTRLRVDASKTVASSASAVWDGIDFTAGTLTLSGSTNVTTATGVNMAVFRAPTYSAASALTVTNAATVTIAGAPIAGGAGPATITNSYALWSQGGTNRFDGRLVVAKTAAGTNTASVFGDQLNAGTGSPHQVEFGNTTGNTMLRIGQSGSNNIGFSWQYNATAGSAWGELTTFGYTNPIKIDAQNIFLGTQVSGNGCNVNIGTATSVGATKVRIDPSRSVASATSAAWDAIDVISSTLTLTGSTAITTTTGVNMAVFRAPTYSAASALTVTNAATVAIAGAPIGGGAGPATITNSYAVWVQGGVSRFDGNVGLGGMPTVDLHLIKSAAGAVTVRAENTLNSSGAGAVVEAKVAGSSATGNPIFRLTAPGTLSWDMFVDVASGGFFKVSAGGSTRLSVGNQGCTFQGATDGIIQANQAATGSRSEFSLSGTAGGATATFSAYGNSHVATVMGMAAQSRAFLVSPNDLVTGTTGAKDLIFGTNGAERGRFTSAGNLSLFGAGGYGSGVGVISRKNAGTAPTVAAASGEVVEYVEGGRAKLVDSAGVVTVFN